MPACLITNVIRFYLDQSVFARGFVEWSGVDVEVFVPSKGDATGPAMTGNFITTHGIRQNSFISIALPFHPIMSPIGLLTPGESLRGNLGKKCNLNPFCLSPENSQEYTFPNRLHSFHYECYDRQQSYLDGSGSI